MGSAAAFCGMKPMDWFLMNESSRSPFPARLRPSISTVPDVGASIPAIRFSSVDFPLPDRPMMLT